MPIEEVSCMFIYHRGHMLFKLQLYWAYISLNFICSVCPERIIWLHQHSEPRQYTQTHNDLWILASTTIGDFQTFPSIHIHSKDLYSGTFWKCLTLRSTPQFYNYFLKHRPWWDSLKKRFSHSTTDHNKIYIWSILNLIAFWICYL